MDQIYLSKEQHKILSELQQHGSKRSYELHKSLSIGLGRLYVILFDLEMNLYVTRNSALDANGERKWYYYITRYGEEALKHGKIAQPFQWLRDLIGAK